MRSPTISANVALGLLGALNLCYLGIFVGQVSWAGPFLAGGIVHALERFLHPDRAEVNKVARSSQSQPTDIFFFAQCEADGRTRRPAA